MEDKLPNTCPTVRVVSEEAPGGFKVINQGDFRDGEHKLWSDSESRTVVSDPVGDDKNLFKKRRDKAQE